MGTPLYGRYILEKLCKIVDVSLVVCQPDKPSGRDKRIEIGEVKKYSQENNLDICQPDKIKNNTAFINKIKKIAPDFIFVAAYGKILGKEILELPKYNCINVHSSLLPKYRGAAPINWAIIKGEKKTGITIMEMDEGMDTGNIILKKEINIEPNDDVNSLTIKLAVLGAIGIDEFIANILKTEYKFKSFPQDNTESSLAPKISKEICKIDWNNNCEEISNLIRGVSSWPGAHSLNSNNESVTIWSAKTNYEIEGVPGEIKKINKKMFVCCGNGSLEIIKIQKSGKKVLAGNDFINGIKKNENFFK